MTLFVANTSPLELPEIRTMVGQYLKRSDLAQCLRVCRSWHTSFEPLIWSHIVVDGECGPTVESFRRHMHFIKKLTYRFNAWEEYEPVHSDDSPVVAPYDQLRELAIHGSPQGYMWKPTHSIQNLLSLSLYQMEIDPAATDVFWGLCTRLTSLVICDLGIARLPNESMTFEQLRRLELSLPSVHPLDQQLDWITRCPKLASLDWFHCEVNHLPVLSSEAFVSRVANGAWPELSELRTTHYFLSDAQFVRIIHGMRQVKVFDVIGCIPAIPAFTALRSHFHVLRSLIVTFGPSVVGSMVPEILASCPHLEVIVIPQIMSQDILQGRPWVCERSMAHLHLGVFVPSSQDADRHQQLIFERISRLSNLKSLTLNNSNLYHVDNEGTHISLRLGKGLEHLATLKKLYMLNLIHWTHELPMAEAQVNYNTCILTRMTEKHIPGGLTIYYVVLRGHPLPVDD